MTGMGVVGGGGLLEVWYGFGQGADLEKGLPANEKTEYMMWPCSGARAHQGHQ